MYKSGYTLCTMRKHAAGHSAPFMEEFGRHVMVRDDGRIAFTARGRKELGVLFARYGISLDRLTTLDEFQRQMRTVNELEAERTERELAQSLRDPAVSEEDKTFIRSMLGLPEPVKVVRPTAQVIDIGAWRDRRAAAQASGEAL